MSTQAHIQIVQHLQPGGIETLALDLCRFAQKNRSAYIISLEGTKAEAIAKWPRLQSIADQLVFLNKPQGWSVPTLWQLVKTLRKLQAERVHTHHIGPMLYGGLAARLAGIQQWIHTEHDAWHWRNSQHRRIARWCIKRLHPLLVADAGLVAQQMKLQLPGVITDVVYNGIDTQRFCPGNQTHARRLLNLPCSAQLIGCAARLHPVKGQHRLIKLLKHFPATVKLVLAGDGETRTQLEQLALDLNVHDRVIFLGSVENMPAFYRAIDVFCLTSDFEGLPLSPLEAQACATPAIVTDVGGARETVCKLTGAVIALEDENALIQAVANSFMVQTLQSPRQFIEQQYDVRKMVAEYQSLANFRWSA